MKLIKVLFNLLLFISFTVVIATADTYYVSPEGNNSNSGTSNNPWATPGYGSKQLQSGDTLVIKDGYYILSQFYDDMITPLNSGTSESWITIKGEDGNTPILAGKDNLFSAIALEGISYIKIENLEITNHDGQQFREGINATGGEISHILFKNLHIHHVDEFGIDIADVNNLVIDDCVLTHCGFGSIGGPEGQSEGWRNVIIRNCNLSYAGHYYSGGPGPSPFYDRPDGFGIEPSAGPVEINNCKAEHNWGDGLDSKAENTYIYNCIVSNNRCDGIKLWGDGSKVHNSLIYGTGDGISGATPWAAMVIGTDKNNASFEIINVTIHDTIETQNYPVYVQYDSSAPINLLMRNCIISDGYGVVYVGDSVNFTADHNIFYRPENPVQVYANSRDYTVQQIESGELGVGNLSRNPDFVSPAWGSEGDYHLKTNSPAVGAGVMAQNVPVYDIEGNPRPSPFDTNPDIGAYEINQNYAPGQDIIPPSSITDLSAYTHNSIKLQWTAPGDDGNTGIASAYIIKYNTMPITEDNWETSLDIEGEPLPETAGSIQDITLENLNPGVYYYFAIKTMDEVQNISGISNSPGIRDLSLRLYSGWNMVSLMCQNTISIEELEASLEGNLISIWFYNAPNSQWLRYFSAGPSFINNMDKLFPGFGYWINVKYDCVWNQVGNFTLAPGNFPSSKPPMIIYGQVDIPSNFSETYISIRKEKKEIDKYQLNSNPAYDGYYVLEVPIDKYNSAQIYVNNILSNHISLHMFEIGSIIRCDLNNKPKNTRLLQNYPNPFNPETWIPYELAYDTHVLIKIYSISGKILKNIDLGHQKAGFYTSRNSSAYWDGKNSFGEKVISGIYLYCIYTNESCITRKMIICR
ncbi:T9SS type A sorting domain-containing protein [Candidatus Poribacteria bacterium]|nr:T9SS type A sorting domain-containing protein [Candidatus Poribacteria bacterium]